MGDLNVNLINESPDDVNNNIDWESNDSLTFGYYDNNLVIGYNPYLISDELKRKYDTYLSNHEKDYGDWNLTMLLRYPYPHPYIPVFQRFLYSEKLTNKEMPATKLWRSDYKYAGRLWYANEYISFWELPKSYNDLMLLLNDIKNKIKDIYDYDIEFNDYMANVFDTNKVDWVDIPLKNLLFNLRGLKNNQYGNASQSELEKPHLLPSHKKIKTPQMKAARNAREKWWGGMEKNNQSLAQINFEKNKGISEDNKLNDTINEVISINENPDEIKVKEYNNLKFTSFDAIPFMLYDNEIYVGGNNFYGRMIYDDFPFNRITHGDIFKITRYFFGKGVVDKNKFINIHSKEDKYTYEGRIWVERKVISFWEYPKNMNLLKMILNKLKNEIKKIYQIDINYNDFYIDYQENDYDIYSNKSEKIIPLRDYIKVMWSVSNPERVDHVVSPMEKKSNAQRDAARKGGIDFLGKLEKEKNNQSLAQINFYKNKGIAESNKQLNMKNNTLKKINENPDTVRNTNNNPNLDFTTLKYYTDDTIPFIMINNEIFIGGNDKYGSSLYDDFERGNINHGHIRNINYYFYNNGLMDKNKYDIIYFSEYSDYKNAGRIWVERKVISFWEYPQNMNSLKMILNKLKNEVKKIYHIDIDFNNYYIDYYRKDENGDMESDIIPIRDYIKVMWSVSNPERVDHVVSPMEKKSNAQRDAALKSREKWWGDMEKKNDQSLAQINFDKNKGIAESNLDMSSNIRNIVMDEINKFDYSDYVRVMKPVDIGNNKVRLAYIDENDLDFILSKDKLRSLIINKKIEILRNEDSIQLIANKDDNLDNIINLLDNILYEGYK